MRADGDCFLWVNNNNDNSDNDNDNDGDDNSNSSSTKYKVFPADECVWLCAKPSCSGSGWHTVVYCIYQAQKATLPCQLVKLVPDKQLNAVTPHVWLGGNQGSELSLILQCCMQIARLLQSLQGGPASLAAT